MVIGIKIPDIRTDEAEITEILVRIGNKVEAEQPLIAVKGNEASMGVPSPQADIVEETKVSAGDKAQIGVLTMIPDSIGNAADAAPTQVEERREAAPAATPAAAAVKDANILDTGNGKTEVTEILVGVDDKIKTRQPLTIIKGDKASMEVPAPFAGTVKETKVNIGNKVSTGLLIVVFEVASGAGVTAPVAKQGAAPVVVPILAAGVKEASVPDIGGDEVEMAEVMVRVDDRVATEQLLIIIEGDKASMKVPMSFAGVVKELKIDVGDKVKTGSLIMISEVEGTAPAAAPAKQEAATPVPATKAETPAAAPVTKTGDKSEFAENDVCVHVTPLARRLACKFGVNLVEMKGIGRRGRILRENTQTYVKGTIRRTETALAVISGGIPDMLPQPKVDFSESDKIEGVKLGRARKVLGMNLSRNWVVIPHVTHSDKTDIIELEAFREQQNEEAAERKLDVKVTLVVSIIKAITAALEQMPHFNSSLSEGDQRLTLKKYVSIGVVVGTPNDLTVPVFEDVSKRGIIELSRELMTISEGAYDGELTTGEVQGGCFTISSIDGLGTTHFTPVMNTPEVVVLGVSKSVMESVWNGRELVPRLMPPISLSFGHRVTDGANGARFVIIIDNTLSDIRHLVT